eukprot:g7978.t1
MEVYFISRDQAITLRNGVKFISKTAAHQSGAIFLIDFFEVDIFESLFDRNSCHMGRGGALFHSLSDDIVNTANGLTVFGGTIAFIDTTLQNKSRFDLAPDVLFLKNTARVNGGAVLVNRTNTTVEISSTFIGNKAQSQGGGVSIIPSERKNTAESFVVVIVKEASFTRNYGGGGAISIYGRVNLTTLDSRYSDNSETHGGALHISGIAKIAIIKNCIVTENRADRSGGSVLVYEGENVTIEDSTFTKNSGELAGSIYVERTREVVIHNTIFENSTAK